MKRKMNLFLGGVLVCASLAGCGMKADAVENGIAYGTEQNHASGGMEQSGNFDEAAQNITGTTQNADNAAQNTDSTAQSTDNAAQDTDSAAQNADDTNNTTAQSDAAAAKSSKIESQTFDVTLEPLGKVTFASYEPDTSKNALADVVFLIEQDGKMLFQLSGVNAENVNTELFHQVEAVSFIDYNQDSFDDIIIIVSYYDNEGEKDAAVHSTIRYYEGSQSGTFEYQAELSEEATSAVADITIETAKGFLGYKVSEEDILSGSGSWQ